MFKYKITITLLALLALVVIVNKVIFSTFTVAIKSDPKRIFVSSSSPVKVMVVPLNRLGFYVPFDHLNGKFVVQDGADKIHILKTMENELVFTPGTTAGKVVVLYYASNLAFPVEIVLRIESASVASINRSELPRG